MARNANSSMQRTPKCHLQERTHRDITKTEAQHSARINIEYGLTICVNFEKNNVIDGILIY